jgi:hypothetical protein
MRAVRRALLLAFVSMRLLAQPIGSEFRVNTTTTGDQGYPDVAMCRTGFVVVWQGDSGGGNLDVFGQLFDVFGTPHGAEFRVNTYTTSQQRFPTVAGDFSGGFVVTWSSQGQEGPESIFARLYGSSGAPIGAEFRVNSYTSASATGAAVGSDGAGDFVVVWSQTDGSSQGVFAHRYRASGASLGDEFRLNAVTTDDQTAPRIALDASGGFVVVWQAPASSPDVVGRRLDASGAPIGGEFVVNTYTTQSQYSPSIAIDAAGEFVVAWSRSGNSTVEVRAQRFDAAGGLLGDEFLVNTPTASLQGLPSVAAFPGGGFIVAWLAGNASAREIGAKTYLPSGVENGPQFRVNTYTTGQQEGARVAADERHAVVVWYGPGDGSGNGVYGQLYASGRVAGDFDGDGLVTVADVFYLINFLFAGGPPPQ